jgi:hypothetical protein
MVLSENPELTPLKLDSRSERLQIIFYAYFHVGLTTKLQLENALFIGYIRA